MMSFQDFHNHYHLKEEQKEYFVNDREKRQRKFKNFINKS